MLFPYAPAYRGPIYELMDKEFDIDWFFTSNVKPPLKLYDYSRLKRCDTSLVQKTIIGPIVRYEGIDKLHLDKYDIIIAPSNIRNVSVWRLLSKYGKNGTRPYLFFWTHGWYGKENRLQTIIKKKFLAKTDGILSYNERSCKLLEDLGLNKKCLYPIYNSLDYDVQLPIRESLEPSHIFLNHFCNNSPNIIFIGRLTKVKRFDLLLKATAELKRRGNVINVTFIGDGEERTNMELKAKELGIYEQLWFYGACYDERKNARLIYNADLCVSPGNIGLTAMHVMMFGCPAITNDDFNHQMPEFEAIKIGKTGSFFKEGDSSSLADAIEEWFANHTHNREEIRKACFKEIDTKWNPHNQISILKRIFSQME